VYKNQGSKIDADLKLTGDCDRVSEKDGRGEDERAFIGGRSGSFNRPGERGQAESENAFLVPFRGVTSCSSLAAGCGFSCATSA
jgi:hypothetical protein